MKTPEEVAAEALVDIDQSIQASGSIVRAVPRLRELIADAIRDYHVAACREALRGDGPLREDQVQAIREWLAARRPYDTASVAVGQMLAALDHMTRRYLASESILRDFWDENAHLVEEGRRRERAEIIEKVQAMAGREWSRNHSASNALADLLHELAKRGPAPEPMPGDAARARVKELEAENADLRRRIEALTAAMPPVLEREPGNPYGVRVAPLG